jgi:hypothetical protein
MQRLFRLAVLMPCLLVILPVWAADTVINPDKPSEDPKVRAKLLQADYLQGKLTSIEGEGEEKNFVLEVAHKVKGVNKEVEQKLLDLNKQFQAAVSAKDANRVRQLTTDIQALQAKYYEMKDVPYEFALKSDKSLVVRRTKLQPKESDDGKPVKYTEEEIKKLKGDDPKVPGYAAEFKDLDKDIYVKVYIDKSKIKPAPKDKKKDEVE